MLFKFMRDGKEISSVVKPTLEEARKYARDSDIDWDTIDEYEEIDDSNACASMPKEKKIRKPRIDKGSKRNVDNKSKKVDNRKKPEYFILDEDGILSQALAHDEALKFIENSVKATLRVIMGHEIKFIRKVQFKMS